MLRCDINQSLKLLKQQYYLKEFETYKVHHETIEEYLIFLTQKCNYKKLEKGGFRELELSRRSIEVIQYFKYVTIFIIDIDLIVDDIYYKYKYLVDNDNHESDHDDNDDDDEKYKYCGDQIVLLLEQQLKNEFKNLKKIILGRISYCIDLLLLFFTKLNIQYLYLQDWCMYDYFHIIEDEEHQLLLKKHNFFENIENIEMDLIEQSEQNYKEFLNHILNHQFNQFICNDIPSFEILLIMLSKIKNNKNLILNTLSCQYIIDEYEQYIKDNNHHQQQQIYDNKNQSNIQFCGFCENDWKSVNILLMNMNNI